MANKEKKAFGLIIPKQKQNLVGSHLKSSFFDEDDELADKGKNVKNKEGVGVEKVKRHVQNQLQKALEQDPSVFQYDEVYNKIEEERSKVVETKKSNDKREPKYVKNLLKAAEKRQQEYDSREERKQLAEREKEAGEFDDKEVFVTTSYRKKMEELQSYKEEERKKELLESMMDVTKQKDMTGFYKHFLNDLTAGQSTSEPPADVTKQKSDEIDQQNAKKTKTFRPRERRSSSSSSSDDEKNVRRSPQKSSTSKRRHTKSVSSDEERRAFEEIESKRTKKKSSHSSAKVETEIQKKRRFFTPSPSPERTGRRKSDEKSNQRHQIVEKTRKNDEKSSKSDVKLTKSDEKLTKSDGKATKSDGKYTKSDEKSSKTEDKRSKNRHEIDLKSEEIDKKSPPPPKKILSEKEEKEKQLKERLEKMKIAFARRNDDASIDEYRRRYFERKADRNSA